MDGTGGVVDYRGRYSMYCSWRIIIFGNWYTDLISSSSPVQGSIAGGGGSPGLPFNWGTSKEK